jgi:glutathione S-transferase
MQIYGSDLSPYSQRVYIAAAIKGVAVLRLEVPQDGLKGANFLALNPVGRIPLLVTPEGWTVPESAVIAEYIEESCPGPSIWPRERRERFRAKAIAQIVDLDFAPAFVNLIRTRVLKAGGPAPVDGINSLDLAERALDQLNAAGEAISKLRDECDRWLVGETLTMADASLLPFLILHELTRPFNDWCDRVKLGGALEAYHARALNDSTIAKAHAEMALALKTAASEWGLVD